MLQNVKQNQVYREIYFRDENMLEKYYENCRSIFLNYGLKNQKKQFIQELAELIQAITKNDFENFAEELADVQVMIFLMIKCDFIQLKNL